MTALNSGRSVIWPTLAKAGRDFGRPGHYGGLAVLSIEY